jgi:hypothetical protein
LLNPVHNLWSDIPKESFATERSALPDETRQKWEELYEQAILELEKEQFHARIQEAEQAMLQRLEELQGMSSGREEKLRIKDALSALSVLRRLDV